MTQKLTHDEHTARAMLMGRTYIEWLHVYVDPETWRSSQIGGPPDVWVDADSLEPVPHNDKLGRLVNRATDKLAESGGYAPDPETCMYVSERMVRWPRN